MGVTQQLDPEAKRFDCKAQTESFLIRPRVLHSDTRIILIFSKQPRLRTYLRNQSYIFTNPNSELGGLVG